MGGVVVISHGFPVDKGPSGLIPSGLVALSDRLASDSGWRVVACCLRGVGESEGDFSLGGWLEDLGAVVARAASPGGTTFVVGAGTSGALAVCLAAGEPTVRGVACLAAPAMFSDLASDPGSVAAHARDVGLIKTAGEPADLAAWGRSFKDIQPLTCARSLGGRQVLLLHGADDDIVPVEDARMLAEAVGESAELRILAGAGNSLNSDPRAVALLLGWLERQRT
jgi:pimeloyl-ACP methyl ester carboxylesterase